MVHFYRVLVERYHNEGERLSQVKMIPFLSTFFRETTMSGIPWMVKQPGIVKKIFWLTAIGLMTYGLYWELDIFFTNFLKWKASTSVTAETSRALFYPAVTICNNNPVNYEWFDKDAYMDHNKPDHGGGGEGGGGGGGGTEDAPSVAATGISDSLSGISSDPTNQDALNGSPTAMSGPPDPLLNRKKRVVDSKTENIRKRRQARHDMHKMVDTSKEPEYDVFSGNIVSDLATQDKVARELLYQNRSIAGHQLCDMILYAEYDGKEQNITKELSAWHWNAHYGNCYTFNSGHLMEDSPVKGQTKNIWLLKRGLATNLGVKVSRLAGDHYGLYLLLNADTEHYMPVTTQVGWRVVIHNQTEMPFPEEMGVFVMPGTSTKIGISQKYIERLGEVSNILYNAVYSSCVNREDAIRDDPNNVYTNTMEVAYSLSACYKTCYQRAVMKACSCYDLTVPEQGSAFKDYQHSDGYVYLPPCDYLNSTQWICKKKVLQLYQADDLNCGDFCPQACKGYSFETTISMLKWPNPDSESLASVCALILDILNERIAGNDSYCTGPSNVAEYVNEYDYTLKVLKDLEGCSKGVFKEPIESYYELANYIIGNNFAELFIYYKDFNYQTIISAESTPFPDLLAYMGGILGLFFGFSFMTFMEYFQLLIDLILIGIAKLMARHNKTEHYGSDKQFFNTKKAKPNSPARSIGGHTLNPDNLYNNNANHNE